VRGDDPRDDRQAQPGAALAPLAPALGAAEALEQDLRVFRRQAQSVVPDPNAHLSVARRADRSIGVPSGVCTGAL
jgi:hypothetical protein